MKKDEEKLIEENAEDNVYKNQKNKKMIIIIAIICIFSIIGITSFIVFPRIKLNGKSYEKININSNYYESGTKATIAFKNINDKVKTSGTVDTTKPGKYEITYYVGKGIFKQKKTRVVEVVDNVFPIIELKGKNKVTVCPNKDYEEEGYVATDNYDGDITNFVIIEKKENIISYLVEDSSKNKTIVNREIERKDNEKPKLSLIGSPTKYILVNSTYVEQGVDVSDNCDSDLKNKVTKTGSVDTKKTGTYKVKYSVEDSSGNKNSIERKVIVYNKATSISGVSKTGTIYLTFDDGPSSTITPGVLKILSEKGVKATFFVINKSSDLDYLIKNEYKAGHTVALHSYTHNYKTIYSSSTAYFSDLSKIAAKVKALTGEDSKIIRFPGGASNTISKKYSKGIMSYLTNEVVARGYHYFDWNVSSGDAGGAKNQNDVYKNVTKGLSKKKANVVLMHDFENNYKTLNALSDIIDYGFANGYTFDSIDMTTPLVTHKPNN